MLYIKNIFTLYSEIKHNICYIKQEKKEKRDIFWIFLIFQLRSTPTPFPSWTQSTGSLALWLLAVFGQWETEAGDWRARKERSLSFDHGVAMAKVFYSRSQLCRHLSSKVPRFHLLVSPPHPSDIGLWLALWYFIMPFCLSSTLPTPFVNSTSINQSISFTPLHVQPISCWDPD